MVDGRHGLVGEAVPNLVQLEHRKPHDLAPSQPRNMEAVNATIRQRNLKTAIPRTAQVITYIELV